MAAALTTAAGLQMDEWDQELGASALRVQRLLETRAFAYTMVGAGHLAAWTTYIQKVVHFYAKRSSDGYRPPSVLEAEEADRTAMGEVFALCFAGHALEDALSHVAVDRDILRHLFVSGPRVPRLKRANFASQVKIKNP